MSRIIERLENRSLLADFPGPFSLTGKTVIVDVDGTDNLDVVGVGAGKDFAITLHPNTGAISLNKKQYDVYADGRLHHSGIVWTYMPQGIDGSFGDLFLQRSAHHRHSSVILDFSDNTLVFPSGTFRVVDQPPPSAAGITVSNGVARISGSDRDDEIRFVPNGSTEYQLISNGVFQPISRSGIERIEIIGGDGNDFLDNQVHHLPAVLSGGGGNDQVKSPNTQSTLSGGAGRDLLIGSEFADRINGNGGHDTIYGNEGNDRLYGGAENDKLDGGSGTDRLYGDAGVDMLIGGGSNDRLYGGDGDDLLIGGKGNDQLNGNAGRDTGVEDDADIRIAMEVLQ